MKKLISYILEKFKLFGFALFAPLLIILLFIVLPIKSCEFLNNFNNSVKTENLSKTDEFVYEPDSSCLQRKSFEFIQISDKDFTRCSDGMLNFNDNVLDSVISPLFGTVSYYREIPLDTIISIEIDSYTKLQLWMLERKLTDNITDSFNLLNLKSKLEHKNYLLYEKFEVLKTDTKFFNSNIKNTVMANDTIQLRTNISSRNNYIISEKILKNYKFYITEESTYYRDLN